MLVSGRVYVLYIHIYLGLLYMMVAVGIVTDFLRLQKTLVNDLKDMSTPKIQLKRAINSINMTLAMFRLFR